MHAMERRTEKEEEEATRKRGKIEWMDERVYVVVAVVTVAVVVK